MTTEINALNYHFVDSKYKGRYNSLHLELPTCEIKPVAGKPSTPPQSNSKISKNKSFRQFMAHNWNQYCFYDEKHVLNDSLYDVSAQFHDI